MFRAQILLEDWQHQQLKQLALRNKKSLSEIVREWIGEKLPRRSKQGKDPFLEIAGILKGKIKSDTDTNRLDDYIYDDND